MGDADLLLVDAHPEQVLADADVVVPAVAVVDAEFDGALPRPFPTGETEALRPQEDAHRVALRETVRLRRGHREVTDAHDYAFGSNGLDDAIEVVADAEEPGGELVAREGVDLLRKAA